VDGHARGGDAGGRRGDPATTVTGEPFPERATIQAIAFVVSVGTLLIQGWSLPALIRRLRLSRFSDDHAADRGEELKAERVVHEAADEVLTAFRADPPAGMDPRVLEEIRAAIARQSEDVDEMPDPEAPTKRAQVFSALYRDVLAAQREALITERDEGRIEDEAVRAMLERLDLQEAGVSARLESRF
jgi:NhaP-type Na+/H+ or K+/H+ antiporter